MPHHIWRAGLLLLAITCLAGCARTLSTHPAEPALLGAAPLQRTISDSLAAPGVVRFERLTSAEWHLSLSALIDLEHPRAITAGVEDVATTSEIYFYVIEHPRYGLFLIDGGVSNRAPSYMAPILRWAMRDDPMTVTQTTGAWLAGRETTPQGVFLTHLHWDHLTGLVDLPASTPVYAGPADGSHAWWVYHVLGDTADNLLASFGPLQEWQFRADPEGQFEGLTDIFGDGSVWAILVPGHTPGSTAFLVNAVDGPKLVTGDAAHTRMGWVHGIPGAGPQRDADQDMRSLDRLRAFAGQHPQITVFLGHQSLITDD